VCIIEDIKHKKPGKSAQLPKKGAAENGRIMVFDDA
jgi:hypothetical protein